MSRSIVRLATLVALVSLAGCASSHPPASSLPEAASMRPTQRLADGWRFQQADVPGAEAIAFDDASFERVSVPHTWLVPGGGSGYYRGPAWYRRTVHVDASNLRAGRRQILRFGAASLVADVYLNGQKIGTHRGGFAAFTFDVTDSVHDGDNVLAVRVDNAIDKNVSPLRGDFTVYGGLYRDVELITVPSVSISTQDDGSCGVYLMPTVDDASGVGTVAVRTLVRDASDADTRLTLTTTIRDADGHVASHIMTDATGVRGHTTESTQTLTVAAAHRWNGKADPYLYSATVELTRGEHVIDRVAQPFGFRSFSVDAEKGFILNGKPYDLHGVNKHQGRPDVGWADTAAMRAEDFRWIDQLGATFVRLAHYQHPDDELDACDRLGLVAWSELALVNWITPTPEFKANVEQQLRELIKQQYNHPSIAFWSMYNEPEVSPRAGTQEQWRIVEDLNAIAHKLDPNRLTTGANVDRPHGPLEWAEDVAAENRYVGWYGGPPSAWPGMIARTREKFAGHRVGIGEYGAGASIHQHEALTDPTTKPVSAPGKWHPEEWQGIVHEHAWAAMKDQHWLWGKLIWVMFDFGSDGRNEGDHPAINDKGLVTGDRKTAKDAFFYYQANWSEKPVLHLTSRRFNPRSPGPTEIKLYSNCDDVTLSVAGADVPLKSRGNGVFAANVELSAGEVDVKATGHRAGNTITDDLTWNVRDGAATRQSDLPTTRP